MIKRNNNKIKVCHIITKLELGGAQQNTIYTVSYLNKDNFVPVLISGRGGILDKEVSNLNNVKTYFIPNLARKINPFSDILSLINIFIILLKEKPDIVHTHSSKAGILGRLAAHFARVPLIVHTFHGFGFNDFQKFPIKIFFILLEKLAAKISDKLIVVTEEDRKKGMDYRIGKNEQYELIRSGINISAYKNIKIDSNTKKKEMKINLDEKVIATIAPFKPQKNLRDFIKVSKKVFDKEPKCKFIVIGDGEQRELLEKLILELHLTQQVQLLGWRRDIAEILSISDVFALTSLWEGLPRSILEAMCCGIPVVANSVDGVKEIIKDNETGFLVEPFNTDIMSAKILQLLRDNNLARKIGDNGRSSIDIQFDIDFMVKQQEQMYLNLTK